MRRWNTTYEENGWEYKAIIAAPDFDTARAYAKARGLGEMIRSQCTARPKPPVDKVLESNTKAMVKVHAVCWLMRLSIASGAAKAEDFILDSSGLLHRFAHRQCGIEPISLKTLGLWARAIQRRIPGYSS